MKTRRNPFSSNPTITGKQVANDLFLVLIGAILQAAAYSIFIAPAGIVPGGVYGISIGINHLTQGLWSIFPEGLPIGKVSLCFNIPLFLLAARKLGMYSGGKTIATFLLIALLTDLITTHITKGLPIIEDDPFLAAVYGGAIL